MSRLVGSSHGQSTVTQAYNPKLALEFKGISVRHQFSLSLPHALLVSIYTEKELG